MSDLIPICGEGDTPVLVAKRIDRRWFVACVNGLFIGFGNSRPTFGTYDEAAAFAREWYEGIGVDAKRMLVLPPVERRPGNKLPDASRLKQRILFIAKRHGGKFVESKQ